MRAGSGCSGRAGGPGPWAGRSVNVIGAVRDVRGRVRCGAWPSDAVGAGSGNGPARRGKSGPAWVPDHRDGAGAGASRGSDRRGRGWLRAGLLPARGGPGPGRPCPPGVGLPTRKPSPWRSGWVRTGPGQVRTGPGHSRCRAGSAGSGPAPERGSEPDRDQPTRGRTGPAHPREGRTGPGPAHPEEGWAGSDQPAKVWAGPGAGLLPGGVDRAGRSGTACPAGRVAAPLSLSPGPGGFGAAVEGRPARPGWSGRRGTAPSRPPLGGGTGWSGPDPSIGSGRNRSGTVPSSPRAGRSASGAGGCGPWRGQAVAGTVSCSVRKVRVRFQASWAWASS